ncbi:MAG: hypothetical protein ABJN11_17245 [Lentilitoribacter sp.]
MSLEDDIKQWDGKSKHDISDIYAKYSAADGFLNELLKIATDPNCSEGATWLIKHALEQKVELDDDQINSFCELIEGVLPWQSILHILQILPFITVPKDHKHKMMAFIRDNTEHENKFVRAWAYNGLYELANTYPEYRDGLSIVFDTAEETEPAAIKARIRNVKKAIAKNWT